MSASPTKEAEVEQGDPSAEENQEMAHEDPHSREHGYSDFDVKEQDRWLPIANGWFSSSHPIHPLTPRAPAWVVHRLPTTAEARRCFATRFACASVRGTAPRHGRLHILLVSFAISNLKTCKPPSLLSSAPFLPRPVG
jgi:hypothetical protein